MYNGTLIFTCGNLPRAPMSKIETWKLGLYIQMKIWKTSSKEHKSDLFIYVYMYTSHTRTHHLAAFTP